MNLIHRFLFPLLVGSGMVVVSLMLSHRSTQATLERITTSLTEEHSRQFESATKLLGVGLQSTVSNYSWWDEMVKFVQDPDPEWSAANVDNIVGSIDGGDALWVLNSRLEPVHAIDLDYQKPAPPFSDAQTFHAYVGTQYKVSYFALIDDELWQVFGSAIQDPEFWRNETPVEGFLLVGKKWDDEWLAKLGSHCQARLQLILPTDPEFANPSANAHRDGNKFVATLNQMNGAPLVRVAGRFDANVITQVQHSMNQQSVIFAGSLLLFFSLIGIAIAFSVIRPLGQITRSLESRNPLHLSGLLTSKTDFGEIARLLSSQFRQGRMLQDEIRRRLNTDDEPGGPKDRENQEALRLRLASDLHDGPLQYLYAAGLKLSSIESKLAAGQTPPVGELQGIRTILRDCSSDLRNLLLDLEPEDLRDQDLDVSLQRFERYMQSISKQSARLVIEKGVLDGIAREGGMHVYYIVRELISNASRHARPNHTELTLKRETGFLLIRWENDGFTPVESLKPGNGLRNIAQRVQQLEGTWNHRIHRGRTWHVTIELPFTRLIGAMNLDSSFPTETIT